MTHFVSSHTCNTHYRFFRNVDSTRQKKTTHIGYKLYLNFTQENITLLKPVLEEIMYNFHINYYIQLLPEFSYPGKNLVIHLGEDFNKQEILDFIHEVEKLGKQYHVRPETLRTDEKQKRRPIHRSSYFLYRYDGNKSKTAYSDHFFRNEHIIREFTKPLRNRSAKSR